MAMNCETVIGLIVSIIVFIMGIVALSIASGTHSTRNVSKKKKKHFKYFKCHSKIQSLRKRRPYFGTRKAMTAAKSLSIATKSYGVKYIFLISAATSTASAATATPTCGIPIASTHCTA
eukprot:1027532_1